MTSEEFEAWAKYELGKPCPKHPENIIKAGKYGSWCGAKDELGRWCSGSWPTEEWLASYRKEQHATSK